MATPNVLNTDRRLQRTRQALRHALLALLPQKGWDEVTVQDICDCANIGRSTFYMHFQNKEELLSAGLSEMGKAVRNGAARSLSDVENHFGFLPGLIEHLFAQRRIFCAVVGRRSGHIVQMRFRELLFQLVSDDLARTQPAGWQRDATAHYFSGAIFELLSWAVDENTHTPEEIIRCFRRISEPSTTAMSQPFPVGTTLSTSPR